MQVESNDVARGVGACETTRKLAEWAASGVVGNYALLVQGIRCRGIPIDQPLDQALAVAFVAQFAESRSGATESLTVTALVVEHTTTETSGRVVSTPRTRRTGSRCSAGIPKVVSVQTESKGLGGTEPPRLVDALWDQHRVAQAGVDGTTTVGATSPEVDRAVADDYAGSDPIHRLAALTNGGPRRQVR